jgi:hypothetical protein
MFSYLNSHSLLICPSTICVAVSMNEQYNVASLSTSVKMEWYIYSAREWDYYWLRHQPEFILISIRLNIRMYSLELCFVLFAQTVDLDAADIYVVSSMPMKGHYQSPIPSNYIPLWCVGCKAFILRVPLKRWYVYPCGPVHNAMLLQPIWIYD